MTPVTGNSDSSFRSRERPTQTKIIATIGPASSSPEVIRRLIEAGVCIFRLNFSHGDHDAHVARIHVIREQAKAMDAPVSIMGDLQGPKIRIGEVAEGGVLLSPGANVIFQRDARIALADDAPARFSSTYVRLIDDLEPGQRVLINDGAVRLLVVDKHDDEVICSVTYGGLVTSGKGINLPETKLGIGSITERDWSNVDFALEHDLDCLAISFVRTAEDVRSLRRGLDERQARLGTTDLPLPIVAKIELPSAVDDIDAITEACEAIMIARGDLGVEMDLARVPVIQRQLLKTVQDHGKPCIVATQMLESMIDNSSPTRAEASDVAGAIFDEADAIMLSGETAVGRYPVLAVETMSRIARHTEDHMAGQGARDTPPARLVAAQHWMAAVAHGAWTVASDLDARYIAVWSRRGRGARYLSQNSFDVPILAVTDQARVARQMQFFRGVVPVVMPEPDSLASLAAQLDRRVLQLGWVKPGEAAVMVSGGPVGRDRIPYRMAVHRIGSLEAGSV
jgi:pyruvate kinase